MFSWWGGPPGVFAFFFLLGSFFFFLLFKGLTQAYGGSQARGQLELQVPATATATQDPSHVCDLHHSSRQHWILKPLSEARDQTCNVMVPSWIRFLCAMVGTPSFGVLHSWEAAKDRTHLPREQCVLQPALWTHSKLSAPFSLSHSCSALLLCSEMQGQLHPAFSSSILSPISPAS